MVGIPLENSGGSGTAGSHWEKTVFPSEIMTPQQADPMIISEFTVKVFEDMRDPATGYQFYRASTIWNPAQYYKRNKNSGCGVIENLTCDSSLAAYCTASEAGGDHCSISRTSKGYCSQGDTFMNGCYYLSPMSDALCFKTDSANNVIYLPDGLETYGTHSRCVMTDLGLTSVAPACILSRCKDGIVEFLIGGTQVVQCPSGGQQNVSTATRSGTLYCPDTADFCADWEYRCPLDCLGNGLCMLDNTCQCFYNFEGCECCAVGNTDLNCGLTLPSFVSEVNQVLKDATGCQYTHTEAAKGFVIFMNLVLLILCYSLLY